MGRPLRKESKYLLHEAWEIGSREASSLANPRAFCILWERLPGADDPGAQCKWESQRLVSLEREIASPIILQNLELDDAQTSPSLWQEPRQWGPNAIPHRRDEAGNNLVHDSLFICDDLWRLLEQWAPIRICWDIQTIQGPVQYPHQFSSSIKTHHIRYLFRCGQAQLGSHSGETWIQTQAGILSQDECPARSNTRHSLELLHHGATHILPKIWWRIKQKLQSSWSSRHQQICDPEHFHS